MLSEKVIKPYIAPLKTCFVCSLQGTNPCDTPKRAATCPNNPGKPKKKQESKTG
jgi:hypothetical protein